MDADKIVLPVGCLYTPMKATDGLQLVEYDPVVCGEQSCRGILNPISSVDFQAKAWTCPFCATRQSFPPHYAAAITETNLPTELLPSCSTIEYILPNVQIAPPVFLMVLDIALIDEELDQVKDSIQQSLAMMPQNALVGFISFGAMVYVHEVCTSSLPKSFAFRGTKDYTAQQVAYQLGFAVGNDPRGAVNAEGARRFLQPVSECEFNLSAMLDDLPRDSWPVAGERRPLRCTGAALSVAVGLLEVTCAQQAARIMVMVGGPCNTGPGAVAGEQFAECIRSHMDIFKEAKNARYTKPALQFYNSLASRASTAGLAVDMFAASLDQVGLYEMRVVSEKTGGFMVMTDSFSMHVFKDSFRKVFDCDASGYLELGFNARIEVFMSRELKCQGAVGCLTSLGKQGPSVSDVKSGQGGTQLWSTGSLDRNVTYGFFFEVCPAAPGAQKTGALQFQTLYHHPSGRKRLRVTTVSRRFSSALSDLTSGFDQEAAAALTARQAVFLAENDKDNSGQIGWIDKRLIRLMSRFADYRKDNAGSFRLGAEFAMFPQFMYHLRRSTFLKTFNASPDETAYYRTIVTRENTMNSLVMIQSALLMYSLEAGPPQPVQLDAASMKPTVILLLDSFFHVVIWRGETIQAWYEAGYQEQEQYSNLKQLLDQPQEDVKEILANRFPVPKLIQTNAGGSQARFVTAKVNPSTTYKDGEGGDGAGVVITDDVSLKTFMEQLVRLAVSSAGVP